MEDIGWALLQLSITIIFMQWAMSACCKRSAQIQNKDNRGSSTATQSQTRSTDKTKSTEVVVNPPVKRVTVPQHSSDHNSSPSPTPTDDVPKRKEIPLTPMHKSNNSAEAVPKKDDSFSKRKPVVVEAKRAGFIQERGFVGRERDDYKTLRAGQLSSEFEDSLDN